MGIVIASPIATGVINKNTPIKDGTMNANKVRQCTFVCW
jgi:hypothetical protein